MNIKPVIFPKSSYRSSLIYSSVAFCIASGLIYLTLSGLFAFEQSSLNPEKQNNYFNLTKSIGLGNTVLGKSPAFSEEDIQEIRSQDFYRDLAFVRKSRFACLAGFFENADFRSELVLESIPERMMDGPVYRFYWEEGQEEIPIIISSDFLQLYNFVYAPVAGLPPVSKDKLSLIPISLSMYNKNRSRRFDAEIIGLSDRFSGIFVPESFMKWANTYFTGSDRQRNDKIVVNLKSEFVPEFERFVQSRGYEINSEKLNLGKTASLIYPVLSALIFLFTAFVILSISNFWLQWKWILEKQKSEIKILYTLGFHPKEISLLVFKKLLPYLFLSYVISVIIGAFAWYFIIEKYHFFESPKFTLMPLTYISIGFLGILAILFLLLFRFSKKIYH